MRVLTFTTIYPNSRQPTHGVFVHQRITALARLTEVEVVAPVPYFPRVGGFGRYTLYSQVPQVEVRNGLTVHHPRFLTFPKVGKALDWLLLYLCTRSLVNRLHREAAFDVIDAHWAYPDGVAAVAHAKTLGVPCSVTVRGSDMNLFARLPLRGQILAAGLRRAEAVVAVSAPLGDVALEIGVSPDRLHVIPNGVDVGLFGEGSRAEAKRRLGLAEDEPIILSVGRLAEHKGHYLAIQALACHVKNRSPGIGSVRLHILGGEDQRGHLTSLEGLVEGCGLKGTVHFELERPYTEIPIWFRAADLLLLMSEREGCPNVVLEALACGCPVVARAVGGVPDLVGDGIDGFLLDPRVDVEVYGRALGKALVHPWDRSDIARTARRRTWDVVAAEVLEVLSGLCPRSGEKAHPVGASAPV